ncbi:MAG: virulence factor [Hyphomicrobiales bacterium]
MAQLTVVYWRDIPAQVIVKIGRTKESRKLDERFEQAIDMAAMRSGASETDAYLEEWRRDVSSVEGDLAQIADETAKRLEEEFTQERVKDLINNGGHAAS